MKRVPLESSSVRAIGYEVESRSLEIEFQTGQVYRYLDVPEPVYRDFLNAPSKGVYFRDHIRDRFRFTRLM